MVGVTVLLMVCPIVEQTGLLLLLNTKVVMPAQAHDFHMSIASGCLQSRALEEKPKNNPLFLFQPAEENGWWYAHVMRTKAFGDWSGSMAPMVPCSSRFESGQIATNTHTLFAGTFREVKRSVSKARWPRSFSS